jgi:predicted unusual protein kinase regulating ubiquinone biosynthesis (AarF/ABC1/UbiB family)
MTDGHQRQQRPLRAAVGSQERPVVPTGALRRTSRLAVLPLRHAARTAAAASRLSRAATDQVASRTAEQVFATLGELRGGAAKLGQAMSVFEAALPEEVAAPYRSALRRLTNAAPAMPAEVARRVVAADLTAAYGPGWQERLVAFDDIPTAAASIGQVHRGQWRIDGGQVVEVAVKVQYPGVGQALRSDLRQARLLTRVIARLTRLNVSGLADELAGRIVEELDYMREGRVQTEVAAAFTHRLPNELAAARAAGAHEPPGRTSVTVPAVYAATPRVLITRWLDGTPLSALLDGHRDLLPGGWRELDECDAADLAARLLGHAIYAPAACTGWMHADLHSGNFPAAPRRPPRHAGLRRGRRDARRHSRAVRAARRRGARRGRPGDDTAGPAGRGPRPGRRGRSAVDHRAASPARGYRRGHQLHVLSRVAARAHGPAHRATLRTSVA